MNTGDADMCGQWFVGYSLLVLSVIGQINICITFCYSPLTLMVIILHN